MNSFRKIIRQVLFAARSNKVYNKNEPAFMLNIFKAIRSVMLAAHELHRQKKHSLLKITSEQYLDKQLCAPSGAHCSEWERTPKTLTAKEYKNPYLVFRRFFKYQNILEWKRTIDQVLDYALSHDTKDCALDLLKLYLHLTRLVEAAHLESSQDL
ncbi:MAG: hypothetical protein J7539_05650 [Niabella sp.]|nr:hypothetical protein [Niabella sp.]